MTTLPSSGDMAFTAINLALGRAQRAQLSMNDPEVRQLVVTPSGFIKLSDFRGKSKSVASTTFFGTTSNGEYIVVRAINGGTGYFDISSNTSNVQTVSKLNTYKYFYVTSMKNNMNQKFFMYTSNVVSGSNYRIYYSPNTTSVSGDSYFTIFTGSKCYVSDSSSNYWYHRTTDDQARTINVKASADILTNVWTLNGSILPTYPGYQLFRSQRDANKYLRHAGYVLWFNTNPTNFDFPYSPQVQADHSIRFINPYNSTYLGTQPGDATRLQYGQLSGTQYWNMLYPDTYTQGLIPIVDGIYIASFTTSSVRFSWQTFAATHVVVTWSSGSSGQITGNTYTVTGLTNGANYTFTFSPYNNAQKGIDEVLTITATLFTTIDFSPDWTPSNESSIQNWYSASNTLDMTVASGKISTWNDISGRNRNFTQSNASFQPSYCNAILNNKPSIFYNGTNGIIMTASGVDTSNFTLACVMKQQAKTSIQNALTTGGSSLAAGNINVFASSNVSKIRFGLYGSNVIDETTISYDTPYLLLYTFSNTQSSNYTFTSRFNGSQTASYNLSLSNINKFNIIELGNWSGDTTRTFTGSFSELIIWNNALTSSSTELLEGFLACKWWGLGQLNILPSSHPYKYIAPTHSTVKAYASMVSTTSALINWRQGTYDYVILTWNNGGSSGQQTGTSYKMTSLTATTTYNITITTYNSLNTSGASAALVMTTSSSLNIGTASILSTTTSTVSVSWTQMAYDYVIVTWPSGGTSGKLYTQTSYTLTGLTAGTSYTISITPYTFDDIAGTASTLSTTTVNDYLFDKAGAPASSTWKGLYSMKRLTGLYTGPCFRIRRSSDNTIADFYADSLGNLTLNTGTTISAWLSTATGYIVTWYDQSGLGNHATQNNTGSQPSYNTTNILFPNPAYLSMPNATVPTGTSAFTLAARHGAINNVDGGIIGSGTYGAGNSVNALRRWGTSYLNYWWGNDLGFGTYAANNRVAVTYSSGLRTGYVNNVSQSTLSSSALNIGSGNNTIGVTNSGEYLTGQLIDVFIFNSALTVSQLDVILP